MQKSHREARAPLTWFSLMVTFDKSMGHYENEETDVGGMRVHSSGSPYQMEVPVVPPAGHPTASSPQRAPPPQYSPLCCPNSLSPPTLTCTTNVFASSKICRLGMFCSGIIQHVTCRDQLFLSAQDAWDPSKWLSIPTVGSSYGAATLHSLREPQLAELLNSFRGAFLFSHFRLS